MDRFFHGSDSLFEMGTILTPQPNSYARMKIEEVRRVEEVLEAHRPEGHLARADSIFLSSNPRDVVLARGGWSVRNMYQVVPLGAVQTSNVAWMVEIEEHWDDADASTLAEWARNYWAVAHHDGGDIVEYRTPRAEILRQL